MQVAPQVIPAGVLDTVPVPDPVFAAVSALHCDDGVIVSDAVPAAPPAGVPFTPIDEFVVVGQLMTVVVRKQPSVGSEVQRSSSRGGLPSAHGTLSPTLSDVASSVSDGCVVAFDAREAEDAVRPHHLLGEQRRAGRAVAHGDDQGVELDARGEVGLEHAHVGPSGRADGRVAALCPKVHRATDRPR